MNYNNEGRRFKFCIEDRISVVYLTANTNILELIEEAEDLLITMTEKVEDKTDYEYDVLVKEIAFIFSGVNNYKQVFDLLDIKENPIYVEISTIKSGVFEAQFQLLDYKPRGWEPDNFVTSYEFFMEDYIISSEYSKTDIEEMLSNVTEEGIFEKSDYSNATNIHERANSAGVYIDQEYGSYFKILQQL